MGELLLQVMSLPGPFDFDGVFRDLGVARIFPASGKAIEPSDLRVQDNAGVDSLAHALIHRLMGRILTGVP
jgi:hypothetical protein